MTYISPLNVKSDRIEDIFDLQSLKTYACQKVKYRREWYLNCMDCAGVKNCKAGQQAMLIMEKETKAPEVEKDPERRTIVEIFQKEDPVKALLGKYQNMRGPSVYAKVNVWRKNHPDLEEKYHMVEKVRFLWRKPYDRMKVEDILKELYPGVDIPKEEEKTYKSGVTLKHEVKELAPTNIAPNSKVYSVKPAEDEDSISLEEFLAETGDDTPDIQEKKEVEPDVHLLKEAQEPSPVINESSKMADMLVKLENELKYHSEKIEEIRKQIEAIHTVQKLIG